MPRNPEKFEPGIRHETEREFEKELEKKETRGVEKLEVFLREASSELKENGFPVEEDCRINMDAFETKYSPETIENDKERIKLKEESWLTGKEKAERSGEKLEMLKTATFHKFLKKDFFVLRSSIYDDVRNKIDNVIVEKDTGNLVCAFDEVADTTGPRFEEKKEKVLERNSKGGGFLKYGLKIEEGKVVLSSEKNIPIFYLPLSDNDVREGIEKFTPSSEKSEYEKKIIGHFLSLIDSQIFTLRQKVFPLNHNLRRRLDHFEKKLKEIEI